MIGNMTIEELDAEAEGLMMELLQVDLIKRLTTKFVGRTASAELKAEMVKEVSEWTKEMCEKGLIEVPSVVEATKAISDVFERLYNAKPV